MTKIFEESTLVPLGKVVALEGHQSHGSSKVDEIFLSFFGRKSSKNILKFSYLELMFHSNVASLGKCICEL